MAVECQACDERNARFLLTDLGTGQTVAACEVDWPEMLATIAEATLGALVANGEQPPEGLVAADMVGSTDAPDDTSDAAMGPSRPPARPSGRTRRPSADPPTDTADPAPDNVDDASADPDTE